jgi:methylenetetrahydrofolate--tRNA-(uracil-5-)-methyltransferase
MTAHHKDHLADAVHVVGGGLAGSEAAWQIANAGVSVVLHEMRPVRTTEAHRTDNLAELVCSNSFRSDDAANNAVGLLHAELRKLNSLIMRSADANQVPAGGATAFPQRSARRLPRIPRSKFAARKSPDCPRRNGKTSSSRPGR